MKHGCLTALYLLLFLSALGLTVEVQAAPGIVDGSSGDYRTVTTDLGNMGEKVVLDRDLSDRVNFLSFIVPWRFATLGLTYSQFRYSTDTGRSHMFDASDKKVKDDAVAVISPADTPTNTPSATPTNSPTPTSPAEVIVDQIATPNGIDRFTTIQEGVNAVAPGGIVRVRTGIYSENVHVRKSMTILGQGFVALDGGGSGVGIQLDYGYHCLVSYMEIRNFETALQMNSSSACKIKRIKLNGVSNRLDSYRCNIYNNSAFGFNNIDGFDTCTAEYNWWGHLSGPDDYEAGGTMGGSGDKISAYVDADPISRVYVIADVDGDGLADGYEDTNGNGTVDPGETDPDDTDSDDDGVEDGVERQMGTSPLDALDTPPSYPGPGDSDGDGFSDAYEVAMGYNPANASDFPPLGDVNGDGVTNNSDVIVIFNLVLSDSDYDIYDTSMMDINRSGDITDADAICLFNWVLGNIQVIPF